MSPGTFLRLVRDLLTLLTSLDADRCFVLAEYLPDREWEHARLRRRGYRHWVLSSIGERLSLTSAVVSVLRAHRRRRTAGRDACDPFQHLWSAMPTTQRDTLRRQATIGRRRSGVEW